MTAGYVGLVLFGGTSSVRQVNRRESSRSVTVSNLGLVSGMISVVCNWHGKSTWLLCEFWDGNRQQRIACSEDKNITVVAFKWRCLWNRNNTHNRYGGFEWRHSWPEMFVLFSVTVSNKTHIAFRRRCLLTKCSLNIRINTSRGKGLFLCSETSKRLCSPPTLLASAYGCSFPEGDWPRSAGDHSRPSTVWVKNGWSHTSTPLTCLHGVDRNIFTFLFTIRYTQML